MNLFENEEIINLLDDLKKLRYRLFGLKDPYAKKKLRERDKEIREQLCEALTNIGWATESAQMLSSWDPFDQNASAKFFDTEWMFGIQTNDSKEKNNQSGFDIVIANPPYIGEKNHTHIFEPVKNGTLSQYYLGKMDFFYFFFHLALNITKPNGTICFITTNYYPTATGAKKLRKDFYDRSTLLKMVNFNEIKVFESALGQHNMITILSKGKRDNIKTECISFKSTGIIDPNKIISLLKEKSSTDEIEFNFVNQEDLYDGNDSQIRLEGHSSELGSISGNTILSRLSKDNPLLGEIFNINQGIVTGADKVTPQHISKYNLQHSKGTGIFVLTPKEISSLNLGNSELSILKPWFKNSDIQRWVAKKENTYSLLYLDRSIKDISPIILNHLKQYKSVLERRREVENSVIQWWQLQWPREKEIFESPKIMAPQRSKTNTFAYTEEIWYASADVYYITKRPSSPSLKYVLALLNSTIYLVWLLYKGKRKGASLELYQKPLSEIPIKAISEEHQALFDDLVDSLYSLKSNGYEKEYSFLESIVDLMVFGLFYETEMKANECYINDLVKQIAMSHRKSDTFKNLKNAEELFQSIISTPQIKYGLNNCSEIMPIKICLNIKSEISSNNIEENEE